MEDEATVWLLIVGAAFAILAVISFALHFFVALRSPPTQRAGWTAGIAYVLTTMIFAFGGMGGFELLGPVLAFPAALIAFIYWRSDFRKGWIDHPEELPDGVTIANDDWLAGLIRLVGLVVSGMLVTYFRHWDH
jgi:hypothetical protein